MKKTLILIAFVAALCSCEKELTPPKFGEVSVEGYDGDCVSLTGEAQTFYVEMEGDDWFAVSPTLDTWLIAYEKDGRLYIKVSENNDDIVRESHVDVRGSGEMIRLNIRQDYFRNLTFVTDKTTIGAADGTYKVALATNIQDTDLSASVVEGENSDWVTSCKVENGYVVVTVTANPSEVDSRHLNIQVKSTVDDDYSAKATLVQLPMTGFPYEIPVASIDFAKYPVYNVMDAVSGDTVARVANEYLFKFDKDKNKALVDSIYTVIYPVTKVGGKAKVDYTRGLVLENGGDISWNVNININSAGDEMIAHYVAGSLQTMPMKVYIPRGSVQPRLEELSPADKADKVAVEIRPMMLEDQRGDKLDTYPVVKIANQYWIKENLRALRYPDGTMISQPGNEATYDKDRPLVKRTDGQTSGEQNQDIWVANCSPRLRPMVTVMANSDRYWNSSYKYFEPYRQTMGCVYTYPVLIGAVDGLDVSKKSKLTITKKDAMSPAGWKMPETSDFQIMINYLLQSQNFKNTKEKQEMLIEKMASPEARVPGKNICGFSAHASHVTSAGGCVNSEIVYPTLDYVWASSKHCVNAFKLVVGNNSATSNVEISNSYHVRLIKEE